jgi:alpha-2-macroglobulin
MTLTTPLVVEATWPRFVAPDDTFQVPVKLFNSTDRPLTVRVDTHVTGPVTVAADAELDHLVVRPGEPVLRFLQARATAVGDVQVLVEAKVLREPAEADLGEGGACHTTAMFPVRPASTPHTETRLDSLQAGKGLAIVPSEAFVQGTIRATVGISPKPSVQLAPALERLIHYPYGCVEQTSSQLFSLLYAGDVLGGDRAAAILPMVQAGISRLWSMQTPSGGLGYWPGDTHPNLWGTAYASSCLLEARTAGHKIEEQFTKELTKYLTAELNNTGDRGDSAPDENTRALICRVLAAFGEPSHGWMARLAEQTDDLDQAGLAHLAGAYFAAGRKDRATALLPTELPADPADTTTCGRLTSPVREDAVLLGVLMDIDPKHPLVVPLVARLEKARKDGWWGSTLDNASAIAALSRYQVLSVAEKPDFTGSVRAGDVAAVPFRHDKPFSQKFENVTGPIEIASAGAGTVYVSVAFEGLAPKGAVKPYEHSLKVERKWFTSAGASVDPAKLHVGDLVRVELTVRSPRTAGNVAIVDCLPGGLEVENPRLATSAPIAREGAPALPSEASDSEEAGDIGPRPDFTSDGEPAPVAHRRARAHVRLHPRPAAGNAGSGTAQRVFDHPDRVEFLDDRVVLFCSVGPRVQTFSYCLRVTTAGEFVLPPIQASCMYDPAVACLGAEGKVKAAK